MRDKLSQATDKALKCLLLLLWSFIMAMNFLFANIDYSCKKEFAFPNIALLVLGLVVLAGGTVALSKIKTDRWKIIVATMGLFLVQAYVFFNIYFCAQQWDVWGIYYNANLLVNGNTEELNHFYFSSFPNNQLILLIQAFLLKLNKLFGIFDTDNGLLFIILLQCAISSFGGKCLFDILKKMTKSDALSWMGWLVYVVLIGLSGWNAVTYTDMIAIAFPLMILKRYLFLEEESKPYWSWFLIFAFSYWGFKIKPTVIIVLIAILIAEALSLITTLKKDTLRKTLKRIGSVLGIGLVSITLYSTLFTLAVNSSGLKINKEASTGPLHMIMMGLNPENHGVWYQEDVLLSERIANKAERTQAQKDVILQRLKDYGVRGFLGHMKRKSLIIFNDGTFAWGCEGGFFDIIYPEKNELASPFLRSLYYPSGSRYSALATGEHLCWITVLFLSVGLIFAEKKRENTVILLSLIGIILFNYLFEARARYLLLYVPFFILAAMISLQNIKLFLKKKVKKADRVTA